MEIRLRGLAILCAALIGLVQGSLARAGGNQQLRNPANLAEVFDRRWDPRQIPLGWVMSADGLPGSAIDNATLSGELQAAFDSWEALATSALDFEFGGEVPFSSGGAGSSPLGPGIDGRNLVTFTDPDLVFPPGVLAVALTFAFTADTIIDASNSDLDGDGSPDLPMGTYAAGTIFDGDIIFNSSEPWSVSGASGSIDVRAVALHEIGHFTGLAHSSIRTAAMWPFLANDVSAARTPAPDDVAYASFYYPQEPAYSATFGSIRGTLVNGSSSLPILGGHVFAVEPLSGQSVVGAFTGDDGSFAIPGLVDGPYLVAIEPLDGDPVGLDPVRINEVIAFTFDTDFPEEFFDLDESNVEADPLAGLAVGVTAGADTTGVGIITNTVEVPGANVALETGYNLFSYPVSVPGGLRAFELLQALGDETELNALERYDSESGRFERAEYDAAPSGVDFPVARGEGYVLYADDPKVVSFAGGTDCPPINLTRGLNLIGVPCPPAGYTAFSLLPSLGARFEVRSVERYDADTGTFQRAEYDAGGVVTGDDFPVVSGEGYVVDALTDRVGVQIPAPGQSFAPVLTGLSPGRGVPGTIVVVSGEGFDPDVTKNVVTFNGVGAGIIFATSTTLTVTVPAAATTGPVRVFVAAQVSNAIDFLVESSIVSEGDGPVTELVSGQTALGALSAEGEQDRYTFTALAGSIVTVSATSSIPGVPDLVLLLEDPFGVIVASDDNGGGGTDPRINNFQLQTTGSHSIVVTNAPGSGIGDYSLTLTIATRSAPPQLSILRGNFQSGLQGSSLPIPLEVFVTGATGAPVSGSAVTFIAEGDVSGGVDPSTAGTTTVNTNASGIVTVTTTLPALAGAYTITVTVPGAAPVTYTVAATTTAIGVITMVGDQQSGTVGQALASPLQIIVQDDTGAPVASALVAFQVVGGGGSVAPAGAQMTDAAGSASTTFTLGPKTSDAHIVAAFMPNQSQPLLFEATPLAGTPSKVTSNKSNFAKLALGTARLNAMQIVVTDIFDNPVPGATVSYASPDGALRVDPGLGPGGVFFTDFQTNAAGLHVAMVTATTSLTPTIDEFGTKADPNLAGTYSITATVSPGSPPATTFNVDVDMGPSMVTASGQNVDVLIGQPLGAPIVKRVFRYQRRDMFEDSDGDGDDDDNGDFRDETFDIVDLFGIAGVTIDLEVSREDGEKEADFSLTPSAVDPMQVATDAAGHGTVNFTAGDVGGVNDVVGKIGSIDVTWFFADGSILDQVTFVSGRNFAESTNVIVRPVVITIELTDDGAGIDLATLEATLNGTAFLSGSAPPAVFPTFPEKLEMIVGGKSLEGLDANTVSTSAFDAITIRYEPSRPKLQGTNDVQVEFDDKVENPLTPVMSSFAYP